MKIKYKYEVAFSFLKEDEDIAFQLHDLISDKLETFIYSKRQNELVGTDGEESFSRVFHTESRIVCVLFRDKWGETPWTRIESTAIKNRAFESGWDFLVMIRLDAESILPIWIPKTKIWLDYERFGLEKSSGIIEYKVSSLEGNIRTETYEVRAERLKRKRISAKARDEYLNSREAIYAAYQQVQDLFSIFKESYKTLEQPETHLRFGYNELIHPNRNQFVEIQHKRIHLLFKVQKEFEHDVKEGSLLCCIYRSFGIEHLDYKEEIVKRKDYQFGRSLNEQNGWFDEKDPDKLISNEQLLDSWFKQYLDILDK